MCIRTAVVSVKSRYFPLIRALRAQYIGDNPAGEMNYENAERRRDSCSYHFAYLDGDHLAGSMRITPMGHGLTFSERVLDLAGSSFKPHDSFDTNRLVMEKRYRGGEHFQQFLIEASVWLRTNTTFLHISALCRPKLAPLYLNLSGRVVMDNIRWQTPKGERDYVFISLELETVYEVIKRRKAYGSVLQQAG